MALLLVHISSSFLVCAQVLVLVCSLLVFLPPYFYFFIDWGIEREGRDNNRLIQAIKSTYIFMLGICIYFFTLTYCPIC